MKRIRKIMEMVPAWLLTAVVLAGILWATLAPDPFGHREVEPPFPNADKVVHAVMFGILTFTALVDWARGRSFRCVKWYECLLMALVATLIGVVIEYAQRVMDLGRSFDYMDMAADAAGAFAVAGMWIAAEHVRFTERKNLHGRE